MGHKGGTETGNHLLVICVRRSSTKLMFPIYLCELCEFTTREQSMGGYFLN